MAFDGSERGAHRPLTVLVGCEGRHLFEAIHDPRIRLVTSLPDSPDPDLIVFPCGQDRRFEKAFAAPLPAHVRSRLADGHAGLVFDASTEGVPHKPDVTASLHQLLQRLGVPPRRCVYLTQDRQYEAAYRAHCAAIGCERPVAVLNHDYWIWLSLDFGVEGEQVYRQRLEAFRARRNARDRRFLSLNRTPRPPKILFLLTLLRDGLWDAGFISFGGFGRPGGTGKTRPTPEQLAGQLPGFEDRVAELAPMLDTLDGYGRVLLGMHRHGWKRLELWNASLAADLEEFNESWFTIVTETEMRARPCRITEKVIKPLVNFHPLLVLGNPGSLKMIRNYGFATFDEMFDESYDEECDPRRRFDLVYREFVRWCRADERDLRAMEETIAEKMIFNARWGLTRLQTVYRDQRDVALVNDILSSVELRRAPSLAQNVER